MPKPVTPFAGCDVFITDEAGRVLLIRRVDNGLWALPGGGQDLGETPMECAVRECSEETGLDVRCTALLGVFSSARYEYVTYPWKENEFCHLLFRAVPIAGQMRVSDETSAVEFFARDALPELSDGHRPRLEVGFRALDDPSAKAFYE